MPTQQQMETVVREIDAFLNGLSVVRIEEKHGVPASQDRRFFFWDELIEKYREDALASEIDWEGFTDIEKADVIGRVMAGERPGMWMQGTYRGGPNRRGSIVEDVIDDASPRESVAGSGRMPGDGLLFFNEPVGFQVWHRHGKQYEHVASVESNALGAIMMTTHGFMGYDAVAGQSGRDGDAG